MSAITATRPAGNHDRVVDDDPICANCRFFSHPPDSWAGFCRLRPPVHGEYPPTHAQNLLCAGFRPNTSVRCSSCLFSSAGPRRGGEDFWTCRANPPRIGDDGRAAWPLVREDEQGCGAWRPVSEFYIEERLFSAEALAALEGPRPSDQDNEY
jgi:hypothetical protein